MAIKSADQISIVDLTDAYSVILTNDSYTFVGTTNAAKAGTCTTQVLAMRGSEIITATVDKSKCTCPTGISIATDGATPSPTLTITATTSFTTADVVKIPVTLENGDITITKEFSVAIAFTGAQGETGKTGDAGTSVTISSTSVQYASSASNTTTPSSWQSTIPAVTAGNYLWTKTYVKYSDSTETTSYSVAKQGETGEKGDTGTSVTVSSTSTQYVASTSGTATPTSGWQDTIPTVDAGSYLWTKTTVTYSDGKSTTTYTVALQGKTGASGEDAITLTITSSEGTIFKNSSIATTLTAHVYKGGVEVTGSSLTALGTIKWYKDGSTTATATGQTLTISAGDVTNKATYIAQLEG